MLDKPPFIDGSIEEFVAIVSPHKSEVAMQMVSSVKNSNLQEELLSKAFLYFREMDPERAVQYLEENELELVDTFD